MDVDPADGLPISNVGEWALEKHERLRKYIDISREARRKYVDPSRSKLRGAHHPVGGATYIDLFSGPGRCRIRETGEFVDGSPLVAYKAGVASKVPFSKIHLADVDLELCRAAVKRVKALGGTAADYTGSAEETARQIVSTLNPHGLHFAFLDPFNLEGLSFEVIRVLSGLKHIDMLLHVSVQDLQRNADRYTAEEFRTFDGFAPGWRDHVDLNRSLGSIRTAIVQHWQSLVSGLGFLDARVELVRGSRNQRLYWLALISRHKIANYFWDQIRNVSGQSEFNI